MRFPIESATALRLQRVALGNEPPDMILAGGKVLNVYTSELLAEHQVVIAGDRIAYVGPENDFPVGEQTQIIDVSGSTLIPGLIDAHCHMDFWTGLGEYVRMSLPGGTTCIVTECPAATNALGPVGVRGFLDQFAGYPIRFFSTAPVIPFLCALREKRPAITVEEMSEILEFPEILGLGEIYWSRLLDGDVPKGMEQLIAKAMLLGKTVEGHGAGAKNRKLAALLNLGFDSCHEPISAADVRERLRYGLATMIREGSIRKELETVIPPLVEMKLNLRRAILVSDGVWPNHLIKHGHMEGIVNKAISLGLDPVTAVQMATLNPAEHFHLDDDLGAIAPGKYADLVITSKLSHIDAKLVICRGKVVAKEGQLLAELPSYQYPSQFRETCTFPLVKPDFFRIEAEGTAVKVRAMELLTDIVNRDTVVSLPVINGAVSPEAGSDVLKIAVVDRFENSGRRVVGFIKGFGLSRGAVATSSSFDEGNAIVVGCNDLDMATAVNRLKELGGGIVYCCCGRIIEEIPLPIFGTVSDLPGEEVARRQESLISTLRDAGCRFDNPILTLLTADFSAIPSLRISINGYWLSKENRNVSVFVEN